MGSLEFITWLVAGLAVGGGYAYFTRSEDLRFWMPLVVGTLGAFTAGWLGLMVSPYQDADVYRPGLLIAAFVGAGAFVLGYHLYRMSAAPRAPRAPHPR